MKPSKEALNYVELSKEAMKYVESVSKITGATKQTVVESSLGFVSCITRMPREEQLIIESIVEKYRQLDSEIKDTGLSE